MGKNNRELIPLNNENESYICEDGCGEISPKKYNFVYEEVRDRWRNELLLESSFEDYQCPKCGGFVDIWDDAIEDVTKSPATVEIKSQN